MASDLIRGLVVWAVVTTVVGTALVVSLKSPLLAWRDPVYIVAGFAGVLSLALLLFQPLLVGGLLPGLGPARARLIHRWIGAGLVGCVGVHVIGLWITSPPDVIDVLLFRSPTPFSLWGVMSMWCVVAVAILVACRRRVRPHLWRAAHRTLTAVIVVTTVVHAVLIEGTMGTLSKAALSGAVVLTAGWVLVRGLPRAR